MPIVGLSTVVMIIRSCACKGLLVRLGSQGNTDVEPFEEIPEEEFGLEDVPGLSGSR